jgi:hypothetical protein
MAIDPRNNVSKCFPAAPVHSGMHHRTKGGALVIGISRSQTEPLGAEIVIKPRLGKRGLAPVEVHDHQRNMVGTERGNDSGITRKILESDAVGSGNKAPRAKKRNK